MKLLKRSLAAVLAWGLLLGLTGCVVTTPLEKDRLPQTTQKDTPEVELSVEVEAKAGQPVLQVLWRNNTEFSVTYGEPYSIQYYQEGQWVSCAVGDQAFITIAYMLDPGQFRQESYDPSRMFNMTKPGNYRFLSNCIVHDGVEGGKDLKVSAEFTLPDELVVPTLPVFQSPPRMTVADGETNWQVSASGYSWSCPQDDGTVSHTIADARHPLYCRDTMKKINVTGTKGKLAFLQNPNKVTIRCWPDTAWERDDISAESVTVSDTEFEWKTGGWIYEVTATWTDDGRSGYGEAHYYFFGIKGVQR